MATAGCILIVDDELPNRELLEGMAETLGYASITADSGPEALARLEDNPDVLLLDLMMPGMDGFEVIRRVRESATANELPIIVVTALNERKDRLKAVEAGANDYITKPVERAELAVRVAAQLKIRRAQQLVEQQRDELRAAAETNAELYERERGHSRKLHLLTRIATETGLLAVDDLMQNAAEMLEKEFPFEKVSLVRCNDASTYAEDHPHSRASGQNERVLPITCNRRPGWLLSVRARDGQPIPDGDAVILELLANQLSRAIENAALYDELNRLFGTYVPAAVAQHVLEDASRSRPGGKRQVVSVLFADLRGFSAYAEDVAPETLFEVLNTYLSIASEAIVYHGGTLDKFMGDAVLALFNAPETQEDHALRAALAALLIREKTALFNTNQARPLRFSVGINTGAAAVGHIGTSSLLNYTAIGDVVNVARRLQETAEPGQILISAATCAMLPDGVRVDPMGNISVKGRSEAVETFRLTRTLTSSSALL